MEHSSEDQAQAWRLLLNKLRARFGKVPDLQAVLYLIGMQELGRGNARFTKEEKQDLMHIAICKLLSLDGYYKLEGIDEEGWPHWKLVKKPPFLDLLSQETLLQGYAIAYFEQEIGW